MENSTLKDLRWWPYLAPALITLVTLIVLSLLVQPVAADNVLTIVPPTFNPPQINITPWDPETGYFTRYWFDYETGAFQPYAFLQSIMMPFTDIMGYWIFIILWGVYLFGIWNRERSIELTMVMMLIGGPLWGLLLPPETFQFLYVCIAMGLAAIAYKLYKSGQS